MYAIWNQFDQLCGRNDVTDVVLNGYNTIINCNSCISVKDLSRWRFFKYPCVLIDFS